MYVNIILPFVFICFLSQAKSQISIVLRDSASSFLIEEVVVQQFQSQSFEKILDVQLSDDKGVVTILQGLDADSLFFSTTHLRYNVKEWKLATADCTPCILELSPEKFQLPEIKVTAKDQGIRVLNDTIRFDLNVFKNNSQKDLQDLLQDLPGIEIRGGGEVLYNNKKIDKVLLSGKDVLNSQFDLANRLVRTDLLETIQIVPGEYNLDDDSTPQYLDIVLAKDHQFLADIGVGISHEARTEQKASALFTGDRPLGSFFNFVRKSLDQPALSGGDALRKKDIDIFDARTRLLNKPTEFSFGNLVQDGIDYNDLLFQFNAKLNKDKYISTSYFDVQKKSFSNLAKEETTNPIINQNLERNDSHRLNDIQSFSAYTKHAFELSTKSEFLTYLSFDINSSDTDVAGSSQFLMDTASFSSLVNTDKHDVVWYNSYSFDSYNKIKIKVESDFSLNNEQRNTSFLSTDSLFQFKLKEQSDYIVKQERDRSTLSALIRPTFDLVLNDWNGIGLSGKYIYTRQSDRSALIQDPTDATFNTNSIRNILNYESVLHYNFTKDKIKFRAEAGYARQRFTGIVDNKQDAFVFLLRYNYKITPKILWANTVSRSLKRFSNQELFTSVNFQDNRSYSIYEPQNLPSFLQWNATTVFRYLNTANAKIAIASFSYSRSGRSLAPQVTVLKNSQLVQYVEADASNQFRANGFFRWAVGSNHITANVNLLHHNAFIINESEFQKIISTHQTISLKYKMHIKEETDLNVGMGYSGRNQDFETFRTGFTTFSPSLELRQFLKPKIWLNTNYQPILRVGLDNQHVLDISISSKFLRDKLTIEFSLIDILNFNNPEFIQRSINPFIIREAISARVGGYALLSATYQFQ